MASIRIQHGLFGLLGMLWLLSALSITGGLEMVTKFKYLATCGENLTLECKVESNDDLDIKRFYWMEKKDICDWGEKVNDTEFECESISNKSTLWVYNFSLTILNVQPKHKGTYHCKLRAKEGVKNDKTILRVQKCVGNSESGVTSEEAKCTFEDVFPEPRVEWTLGTENLTHLAKTTMTENTKGLLTVVSTIKLQTSNTNNYNCSLVMPIENENNETVVQAVRSLNFSGGYMVIPHWFGVVLAMVLGMLTI